MVSPLAVSVPVCSKCQNAPVPIHSDGPFALTRAGPALISTFATQSRTKVIYGYSGGREGWREGEIEGGRMGGWSVIVDGDLGRGWS